MVPFQTTFEDQLFRPPELPVQQPCTAAAEPPPTVFNSPSATSILSSSSTPEPTLPPEFATIWAVLELHRGADQAITAPKIAESAGIWTDMADTNRGTKVRKILELTQDQWPEPVCGDANGYYIAATAEECTHYCANLRSRAMCDLRRFANFRRHAKRVGFQYYGHGRWADPESMKGGAAI